MKTTFATLLTASVLALSSASVVPAVQAAEATKTTPAPAVARDYVIVDADVVRLGDLFSNAGAHADKAVAYAPDPGQRAVFDLNWLARVAQAYQLNWRPLDRRISVTVQRDGQAIGNEEIADHILAALIDKGVEPDSQIDISNRSLRLYVPTGTAAMVGVEDITFDRRTRRFTAIISAPAGDPRAKRTRVTGQAHKMVQVPVLTRRISEGDVIGNDDIQIVSLRSNRIQSDVVMTAEELIGKTSRRGTIKDEQPVLARDVGRPLLVKKGSLVTMIMRVRNMTLTSKGKALDDGSDGDTVRIANSQSKTIVETVVIGTQRVSVVPLGQQYAQANFN